jgi:thymidylate synthase
MTKNFELQYAAALREVLQFGVEVEDRTGTGTFCKQHAYFHLKPSVEGFPILKMKKMNPKHALVEIAWMLDGQTNIVPLVKNGVNYWNEWADDKGDLGCIYGLQMRCFGEGFDQLKWVIENLKANPDSRQNCMSLWNPEELGDMSLPPCHVFYQFRAVKGKLHIHIYQRSADAFLGMPYDFMLSAYMQYFLATICELEIGDIHYTCGDFHIYKNHVAQVKEYLSRIEQNEALTEAINLLTLKAGAGDDFIINWSNENFEIDLLWALLNRRKFDIFDWEDYKPFGFIKAPISV